MGGAPGLTGKKNWSMSQIRGCIALTFVFMSGSRDHYRHLADDIETGLTV
jgi:hypothetical protein